MAISMSTMGTREHLLVSGAATQSETSGRQTQDPSGALEP